MAMRAGHDINYLSLTGALHAIGEPGAPPTVPLNLIGDYGGGTMFLVAGMFAGFLSAQRTGQGQAVDAAITDGVGTMLSLFHAWLPSGQWVDERARNLLDGGAPFYRCYACADGGHVAVGCLEPQFFAAMIAGLGLEERGLVQPDRAGWPAMEAELAAVFVTRPRDEWAAMFAATDACVTPVLSLREAIDHPPSNRAIEFHCPQWNRAGGSRTALLRHARDDRQRWRNRAFRRHRTLDPPVVMAAKAAAALMRPTPTKPRPGGRVARPARRRVRFR